MKEHELFTIGEVAKAAGITRRMILNYEERGLIQPDEKDGATGNRYYTIDTFTQIRTIRVFQNLGLSLEEIRGYFEDSFDLMPLIQRLEALRDELEKNIARLRERAQASGQVMLMNTARQTIYRQRYSSVSVAEKTVLLRNTALEAMRAYGTDITQRMYFTEYSLADPKEVSFCVAVPPDSHGERVETLPSVRALSLYHHGAYEDLPEKVWKLLAYARQKGLEPTGTVRHVYYEGPPQHKDPSKFITQIILPLKED